uniref:Uncharacterized protein n=1 Tax=Picea sitchensis TaxID=3332 RepID=A9P0V0_PICSI|nr:unknown [Picea sitchensis]
MASCEGTKRLFDMESSASGQQEASNTEPDRVEAKRQRTAMENAGDDFEEFWALMDRIRYMKTNVTDLGIWEAVCMPAEDLDAKVIKSKSPWIPSFEWEDFCVSAAKDTVPAETGICSSSSSEEKARQSIQPANSLKTPPFWKDAYNNLPAESFDLNVEASP